MFSFDLAPLFTISGMGIFLTIVLVNGVLSVDNAAAVAAVAQKLPENMRDRAIQLGMIMAMALRVVCLIFAFVIIQVPLIKILGAVFLFYLVAKHFWLDSNDKEPEAKDKFWSTIVTIGYIDLAFSIDNIVATVGMTNNLLILILATAISILIMMVAAQLMERLMRRYPRLEDAAFLIIGFVGVCILMESAHEIGWQAMGPIPQFQPFLNVWHIEMPMLAKLLIIGSFVAWGVIAKEAASGHMGAEKPAK